jgi:dTDP-4-amino-4,6-dideoxygalactose transaminase
MYYIVCRNANEREGLIQALKSKGVLAVFHYLSLHKSAFFEGKHDGRILPNSDFYSDCLVRLPMYYELELDQQELIINTIQQYFQNV